ncbi:MAG: hypothetical protein ACLVI6_08510 [Bifidobacterium bifidum]
MKRSIRGRQGLRGPPLGVLGVKTDKKGAVTATAATAGDNE